MDRYEGLNCEARKSLWRSDRLDCYAEYRTEIAVYQNVFERRLSANGNSEELLKELLRRMLDADQKLKKNLARLDADYFKHCMEP